MKRRTMKSLRLKAKYLGMSKREMKKRFKRRFDLAWVVMRKQRGWSKGYI